MNANVATMQVATTRNFGDLEIQVYENPAVGHSRAQDDFWMTRDQVGTALGYCDPTKAIDNIHKRNADRLDPLSSTLNLRVEVGNHTQMRQMCVYTLRGVMEICRYSKQPKANAFIDFCWDVMTALMRGETVSLKNGAVEAKRQERFEQMIQSLTDIQTKMDALEVARKQDRQALDNVLFVCKQLDRKIVSLSSQKKSEPTAKTTQTDEVALKKATTQYTTKGRSEWRTEIYDLANKIARLSGLTLNAVLKQAYDYMGRNYGWYFKDERKMYIERTGYKGELKNLSGLDIIEASEMYKSVFMSIMRQRYGNEKHDIEVKKGIQSALVKKPAMIPADMLPRRHKVEPAPEVVEESQPVIVAEAHAVEVETPAAETPVEAAGRIAKKKYYHYKPSLLLSIVEPIAKKLGDRTIGYRLTYQKIYDVIGMAKIERMTRAYIRSYSKPPKSKPELFQQSEKTLKIFKDAAAVVDMAS